MENIAKYMGIIYPHIKEFVEPIVTTYLEEKIIDLYKGVDIRRKLNKQFKEYIERSYDKYLYVNNIVFKNKKKIDDLYVPLTVKITREKNDENLDEYIKIDRYVNDFIPKYKKILLVDSAGMGKSTIMKYLYISAIRENIGIPIFIELRELDKEISILNLILDKINGNKNLLDESNFMKLIENGDFIFFFDGYDEIKLNLKLQATKDIQEFIYKCKKNHFIISSREEYELNSFIDFQRFDINRLSDIEVYELIKKYCKDNNLSNKLISELKIKQNMKIIQEFLDNPLMVSLLCSAYEYDKNIPYNKDLFYRQVYDALYEKCDLSKNGVFKRLKKTQLDIDEFHKVLRFLAFMTMKRGISYKREKLVSILDQIKYKIKDIDFKSSDMIYDIIHVVPLFIVDGVYYRWTHKSFQDYFAASYICNDAISVDSILKKLTQLDYIDKYMNIIDFCYDIDFDKFSKSVILPLLIEIEDFYNETYRNDIFQNYNTEEIKMRRMLTFLHRNTVIFYSSEEKWNEYVNRLGKEKYAMHLVDFDCVLIQERNNIRYKLVEFLITKECNIVNLFDKSIINKQSEEFEKANYFEGSHTQIFNINDDINNKINNTQNFNLVNIYLLKVQHAFHFNELGYFNLDYDKCMEMKLYIENKINLGTINAKEDIDFV